MIFEEIKKLEEEFLEIRHYLHQNPEVGFEEENTSKFLASKLTEYGYEVTTGVGKTGVVGVLKVGEGSKTLGIRAEMDALPIPENTGKPYASQNPGKHHGCGHDGHATMLLCAAKYLAQTKNFNGTLNIIFQPAEELLYGGRVMIEDNLFERFPCESIFSMHALHDFEVGNFYFNENVLMASSDSIDIEVTGFGGHGAIPEKTIDATMIACYIGTALQTIVSRNVGPFDQAVITIGSIQAGDAYNVINGKAHMKLTVRTLNNEIRQKVLKRITEVAQFQAESFGGKAEINHANGSPVLINNKEATDFVVQVATELVGEEKVHTNTNPLMGSEDFAFYVGKKSTWMLFFDWKWIWLFCSQSKI